MRRSSMINRFPSAYTLYHRLLNLPMWIADSLGGKRKPVRRTTRLNVENMEDRIVPTTMSIIYNESDDGGVATLGLSRTLTIGQTLVVEADVARDVSGSASPASPTPTGTFTFQLEGSGLGAPTYTIGTASLTSAGTGVGQAELTTSLLPITAGTYELNLSYSGDSNYSSASATNVATITMQSPPVGAPADMAPSSAGGPSPIQIPSGDGIASSIGVSAQTGVNYSTLAIDVSRTDLTSYGFGTNWGESWDWTNATGYTDSLSGSGATQTQAPHLVQINGDSGIALVINGSNVDFFDLWGGTYHARFGLDATLTHDTTDHWYVLTVSGSTYTFDDFTGDDTGIKGSFLSVVDPYGDTTSVISWNGAGAPTEVEQTFGSGGSELYEAFDSVYLTSGVNSGLLSTVTQETKVGSGSWTTIATVNYTYYGSSDSYGEAGELETAIVTDAGDNILSAAYYRYYVSGGGGMGLGGGGGGGGDAGAMHFAFDTAGYERMISVLGSSLDTYSDADVAPYAQMSMSYSDGDEHVLQVSVAGDGLTLGTFNYSITTNSDSTGLLDPNVWATKTTEEMPDGSDNYVFANAMGQTMLTDFHDVGTGQDFYTYYQYDSAGRLILEAQPSAVSGFSSLDNDLVGWSGSSATYLNSSSGLIATYTYGSSTTATSGTAGNVAGYLEQAAIQQGTGGTSIPQESYTYLSNTASSVTVYNVASDTVYSGTGGSGAETTSYAYSYYSDTNAIYSITTTLPTITTGQNGSNSANTTETVYDQFGNPIWTMDPNGSLSYTQYDTLTGAVVESITDANTSEEDEGDFSDLPEGWSSPDGLNLVTTYSVDTLGRTTKETTPNGNVDYFVYIDSANEVREYDGWSDGSETGPTKVTIDDWTDGYTETLTMTATPSTSDGLPTGAESIADVQSLSRSYLDDSMQVSEKDDYFNLGGLTYTNGSMGTSGVNYYATLYGYDADGNQSVTESPQGTIYITVFDGQRRVVSQWVGTDDTPESGTWSPTNNTSPSNMVEVASYQYDGDSAGDGDLTQVTQYPGGGAANRVTDYYYNWEDEKVAEKDGVSEDEDDGVNRPLTVYTYDNLGELTETQVYSGDGITPTFSAGEIVTSGISSDLQAETITSYDSQGQVYQTQQYSVDPTTGDVSENALTTNYYYDPDGNLIAESAPGGLWTKYTYDGAGRQVMEYQTDGGSGTTYAEAGELTDDVVLSQTQTVYDGDGNVIETITSERFNTDSTSSYGALGTRDSGVEARIYYTADYYDAANRQIASVDVGTDDGSSWSLSSLDDVPVGSLVTTYSYDADAVQTISLMGSPTGGTFTLTFDGDTTSSIAYNASASAVQSDLAALGSIGSSKVVVTQGVDGGWQVRFTSTMGGLYQNQITATSSLTGGTSPSVSVSTLSLGGDNGNMIDTTDPDDIDTRNYYDPLGRVVQTVQDFTNGAVSDSSNKTTDYTYNSVGMTTLTAVTLNGSNDVGETTEWVYGVSTGDDSDIDDNDIVSTTEQPNPSTGLPDSSLETVVTVDALGETLTSTDPNGNTHTYTYDVLGQQTADAVTTLGSGVDGSVREITTSYTTLGQPYLITSYASDDGGTVVNQVEDVYNGLDQLTYEYQAVSGSVNTESTPFVEYEYTDIADGNNSRLTAVVYPDGYTVDYNYNSGLDSNISRLSYLSDDTGTLESYKYLGLNTIVEMDHPETDINLTYIAIGDETSSSDDQYVGLDEFGRVVDQNWYDTTTSSSVVNLEYGYDNDGNVLYRSDLVNAASSELYGYDALGQITSFGRGTLTDDDTELSSPSVSETWTYDPLGNHLVDSTGLTSAFNYDNQITSVSSGTTPVYDSNGNMTTDQNGLKYFYDAWNRLVKVENSSSTVLETYSYDGLGDRMTNTVSGTTTNFYYSSSGQILEEQANATGYYTQRYVWSPNYVNEMIDRDTSTSGTLTPTGASFTRDWVLSDANYNVVALVTLVDSVYTVVERYEYDPFGTATVLSGDYEVEGGSSYNWVYGFQGMRLDVITGDNLSMTRELNPTLGVWTSKDPLGFAAKNDVLFGFEVNNSIDHHDPKGMDEIVTMTSIGTFTTNNTNNGLIEYVTSVGGQSVRISYNSEGNLHITAGPFGIFTLSERNNGYVFHLWVVSAILLPFPPKKKP